MVGAVPAEPATGRPQTTMAHGTALCYKGEQWQSTPCPLPSHRPARAVMVATRTRVHDSRAFLPVRSYIQAGRRGPTRQKDMTMTQDKPQKSVIRQRRAETGEPYSVARRAAAAQPATAEDWDEEYYADGAASEGSSVEEFKTREAAGQESRGLPTVDAQAADGMPRPGWRQYRTASFGGVPPVPPMPPVPPAPRPPGFPGASRFRGAARRVSRPAQVPLTEDQARELGPFLEAAREAADRAGQAAALARELAVRAQQQAERTQEHAEQAQERADRAEEWADEEEQEGSDEAQEQAEQAQEQAAQARERADLAEERAMQAQEWAELAQERADEAREWAGKAQDWPAV